MTTASIGTDKSPAVPAAALAALGIVYGDLGTSPLYTLQTVVEAVGGRFTDQSALGVLSLVTWTLIVTVSIKYCLLVMRADNHGEGGILALMSLGGANRGKCGLLTAAGLLGAALIYGDGVITPAISVLSALEGVKVATSALTPFVMPLAVVILVALFAAQRFGTAKIGRLFGPVMLVWFVVIGLLGLSGVVRHPGVLAAIDPRHALSFLIRSKGSALAILGGVFLCTTGGEALYADMGHIGRFPIRLSWYGLVLPCLLLSYAGQTALLLDNGPGQGNPFFLLAPDWAVYPLVALSTLATIIASQAIITGSFSMTRQAMQLGWMPGVDIRQTSDRVYGQIYVPVVNGLMMAVTVAITIGFRSSDRLAGAYGTAVATTMLLTTLLLFNAMRRVWRWPLPVAAAIAGVFVVVDGAFFIANLAKIFDGGWLPLTIGALIFIVMTTWRAGLDAVHEAQEATALTVEDFLIELKHTPVTRAPGTAVFLCRHGDSVPALVVNLMRTVHALPEKVVIVTVAFEEEPRVEEAERAHVDVLCDGLWRVTLRYGFVEIPDLTRSLAQAKAISDVVPLGEATYFGGRDMVISKGERSRMKGWRLHLFAWLFRNAVKMVDRFKLPPRHVIEIARQIEI